MIGFFLLFIIVILRLVQLQLVNNEIYENKLISQHFQHVNIKAKRGNIFIESPSGQPIQLSTNTDIYDIYLDPRFVLDKDKVISELTPVLIEHYCPDGISGTISDPFNCLTQLERFSEKNLLPKKPELFYLGSGIVGITGLMTLPETETGRNELRSKSLELEASYQSGLLLYNETLAKILSGVYYGMVKSIIQEKLQTDIYRGKKKKNYLISIDDNLELKSDFEKLQLPFISIVGNYIYVTPLESTSEINKAGSILYKILSKHQIILSYKQLKYILSPQENKYVKIATNLDQKLINRLKERQEYRKKIKQDELYDKRKEKIAYTQDDMIPLLHGLGYEQKTIRNYPFGNFLSHIIGYISKEGDAISGIEKYRDEFLKGKDGQIIGFGGSWLGQAGTDDLQLSNPSNGANITLTIEPNIQKRIEEFTKQYLWKFRADSVSIIVMNPYNGVVVGLANAPDFNPNNTDAIYQTKPVGPENRQILDDAQYLDIPVYYKTGGKMLSANISTRFNSAIPKYMNTNYFGPLALLDKNTTLAYEPGSIFKPITVGIGLDSDEIELYDTYYDKGELQVGEYYIKNVSRACLGTNTILHALQFSCNIGMVRVIQKIGKHVFYNYLDKFGFGKVTGIEIAGEVPGSIPDSQLQQKSRFFNNSFGQGLLVTPIQIGVAFSALVNGGYVIKPTIIKKIELADGSIKQTNKQSKQLIFKEGTSELIKNALFEVVNGGQIKKFAIPGKTLGGKTGTPQIPYRGKYQNGVGWTNGSFAGIVTRDNTKYVIVIQVRRPRSSQWGELTAGEIFGELAKFLIEYEDIEK